MSDNVNITINGNPITVPRGTTILEAVRLKGLEIPTICFHEHCTPNAVCRTCVVEVEGSRVLTASCIAQVYEGMFVYTHSERVERSRRIILKLLDSAIDLSESQEIQKILDNYEVGQDHFPGSERRNPELIDDNPMFIRDYAKCILCWRCVQVCAEDAQFTYAINYVNRGYNSQIGTFYNHSLPESTCVFCGQCVGVCPTGALKSKHEWHLESQVR